MGALMKFGIWSNGFRTQGSPQRAYEYDLREIVLADELGMTEAWISEHHGEPLYAGKVDVLPVPELLMCKAAALTNAIRFGAAVRVLHIMHPVDIAVQAATAAHMIGDGRFIFGFGSGFPNSRFGAVRGLSDETRKERTAEALELIMKCWDEAEPFDWNGRFWSGRDIVALPKPPVGMPIATATMTAESLRAAGERGWSVLTIGSAATMRKNAAVYAEGAAHGGQPNPIEKIVATASIYVADSVEQGKRDLRAGVENELGFYRERGVLSLMGANLNTSEDVFDALVANGQYVVGDPDSVYAQLARRYEESGGFGTLLYRCGKDWAQPAQIETSMQRFMTEVAPRLAKLSPPTGA
jgi:alkanesulfonate monooxygenase SsuD/methylene tetrahydromethanopterin reductase-like flavin-dependent oxidoreductase (luciferase family)